MYCSRTVLLSIFFSASASAYSPEFLTHVQTKYYQSYGLPPIVDKTERPNYTNLKDFINVLFKPNQFKATILNDFQKRTIMADATTPLRLPDELIDTQFINKLEVVSGADNGHHGLASFISNSLQSFHLELGKKSFIEMLAQPTDNIELITQRQEALNELVENKKLFKQIQKTLDSMKGSPESHFLFLLNKEDPANKEVFKRLYWNVLPFLNNSSSGLELGVATEHLRNGLTWFVYPTVLGLGIKYKNPQLIGSGLTGTLLSLALSPVTVADAKLRKNMRNYIQEYMIGLSSFLNGIKHINQLIEENQKLKNCNDFQKLNTYTYSPEFDELITLLDANTFTSKPSLFSLHGRVLRAYKLMQIDSVKKEFNGFLNLTGKIDGFMALAQTLKSPNTANKYSFAQFETNDTPGIQAKKFWNPFVGNKAVQNSIDLGSQQIPNMILTGPNTGGKSTLLKALMINVLLAQTFGIAAAEEFILTPYAKLLCHLNIADDTAGGVSMFKAEVKRAQDLITNLKNLPQDKFMFVIIDELFSGTSPDQANDLSYKFLKQLSGFNNCLFIGATHFEKPTSLERDTNRCTNYHMGAIINNEGNVDTYTYKLVPGPSPIKNASQVADESGLFE